MDWLPRLLTRLLLALLGYVAAAFVGALVVLIRKYLLDGTGRVEWLLGATWLLGTTFLSMLRPAIIGILVAEIFAIRSWLFHVTSYLVSAWIGWRIMYGAGVSPFNLVTVVGGIAGGLLYWGVAGRNAGLSKPISGGNDLGGGGVQRGLP